MGVAVDAVTVDELHEFILTRCRERRRARILNVNANALNLTFSEPRFRALLNGAELVFCDGFGVWLAAWLAGHHLPGRITYADWLWSFARFCATHNLRWFLLGGAPGRAAAAAVALSGRVSGLEVVGTHHGFFDTRGSAENARVLEVINRAAPDVLIVGFGMPLQEYWLEDNWERLNVTVALTGGAVFDYVSGALRRPPRLLRDAGLEWLGRLLIEPRRLWRRYVIGNPVFLARAISWALSERLSRGDRRP